MARLFSRVWRRRAIICAGLAALAVLAGCSALKLGYGQLPTLAYWWLDAYIDFDDVQAPRVRQELRRWTDWHQRTQLAAYAAHLALVRGEAAQPVSAEQVCRLNDATRELIQPAIERMLPPVAELAPTLTPEQLRNIDRRYRKRTAEMREEMLQPDRDARLKASVERSVERFETFYGSLGDEQRKLVEDGLRASPFDALAWFDQRERRHREMLEILRAIGREGLAASQAQERLRLVVRRFDGRAPLAPARDAAALTAYNCELVARVHNSATAEQRRHLADKLQGWERDLRALVAESGPVAVRGRPAPNTP
jgi:hypothetical protein